MFSTHDTIPPFLKNKAFEKASFLLTSKTKLLHQLKALFLLSKKGSFFKIFIDDSNPNISKIICLPCKSTKQQPWFPRRSNGFFLSFGYQQLHSTYSVHYGLRANDDCCCCFPNIHFPQAIKLSSFHACTSSRWYSIAMYVLVSEMSGYGVPTHLLAKD